MTCSSPSERGEFVRIALSVAKEAAELVLVGHRSRPHVDKKGRTDLVTRFDRASEDLIVARLAALTPDVPVVAEERSFDDASAEEARAGRRWYVDPIDGTTNFVHGHPFWCVAIGLMENEEPVVGAIVAAAMGITWSGFTGDLGYAHRNGEACRVSETRRLDEALIATGFPQNRVGPESNFDSFISVKRAAQAVRRCGSAAMDLCLVADGTYDGYWERRLHAWDTVAASAIVLAAGGQITAISGGLPDYHAGCIVASNGIIHEALRAKVAGPARLAS
jgi:myo-inositol-1(or 4)-monophosphatase